MSWIQWIYGSSKKAAQQRSQMKRTGDVNPVYRRQENAPPEQPKNESEGIDGEPWYTLISSNVDRIRYHKPASLLQVIFKDGSLYEYERVEPSIFMGFLQTHSPGQYVWYVLRQYGYPYRKVGAGYATSAPAANRFEGQPYAVPDWVEAMQKQAGRKAAEGGVWNKGTPTSKGVVPPHSVWQPNTSLERK